jgi:hypothetical protein
MIGWLRSGPQRVDTSTFGLWSWDGNNWTHRYTDSRRFGLGTAGTLIYDSKQDRLFRIAETSIAGDLGGSVEQWQDPNWVPVAPAIPASPRPKPPRPGAPSTGCCSVLFVYDGGRHQVIAQTGDQTWILSGNSWALIATVTSPPFAAGAATYDPVSDAVVLVGGYPASCPSDASKCRASVETWSWNGSIWQRLAADGGPSWQGSRKIAPDGEGGIIDFETAYNGSPSTWRWTNAGWKQLHPIHTPTTAPRGMVFDAASNHVLTVTGGPQNTLETWQWTGSDWLQLHPTTSPPDGSIPDIAYDSSTNEVYLYTNYSCIGCG